MSEVNLPAPEKVRVLLTDPKLPRAELDALGDRFLDAGYPSVAAQFYDRTRTPDRVGRIVDRALKDGDAFLLEWAAKAAPDRVTPELWLKCAEKALEARRFVFARQAFAKAGDPVRAAQAGDALLKELA